jgi:neutral ceramidase
VLDETLRVASARTEAGAEAGIVVNFACHPVCVQAQPLVSADYPGFAMRAIEERSGGVALFTNGACGDADPTRMGTMDTVEWVGGQVARATEAQAAPMTPVRAESVRGFRRSILLPRRPTADIAELEREAASLKAAAAISDRPDPDHPEGSPHYKLYWVREALALARMPQQIPVELQALEIGDWLILGLPGEIAGCLARDIRSAARRHRLWVAGYANGYIGYAVTRSFFDVASYETLPGTWSRLAPGAGEQLRDAAIEFIRDVEKQERGDA